MAYRDGRRRLHARRTAHTMRTPDPRAARSFRIITDIALLISMIGLTILIIAWLQHWNNAIAWTAPPLIGGILTVVARCMYHRYATTTDARDGIVER